MKHNPRLFNITLQSLPDTYYRYFEVGLGYFMIQGGAADWGSSFDYDKYSEMLGGQIDPSSIETGASLKGKAMVHVLHRFVYELFEGPSHTRSRTLHMNYIKIFKYTHNVIFTNVEVLY